MKRILISFLSIILFASAANAACMSVECTKNRVFESWKGKNLDELIQVWGYPAKTKTIAGHKLYIYDAGKYTVRDSGFSRTHEICTKFVEVDKKNNIIAMRWKGARCPITTFTARKWLNPDAKIEEE